jgi:hypothetical protein
MKQRDRFRLEELIQNTWQTKEDIENLLWKMADDKVAPSEDEVQNVLIGLAVMHDIRCRRLFDCFEHMMKQGEIK